MFFCAKSRTTRLGMFKFGRGVRLFVDMLSLWSLPCVDVNSVVWLAVFIFQCWIVCALVLHDCLYNTNYT